MCPWGDGGARLPRPAGPRPAGEEEPQHGDIAIRSGTMECSGIEVIGSRFDPTSARLVRKYAGAALLPSGAIAGVG